MVSGSLPDHPLEEWDASGPQFVSHTSSANRTSRAARERGFDGSELELAEYTHARSPSVRFLRVAGVSKPRECAVLHAQSREGKKEPQA